MQTDCTERETNMQTPTSHFELVEKVEWMKEVYEAVWAGLPGDCTIVAKGMVNTSPKSGGSGDFGWKIVAVDEPGQTGEMVLLTWTDHVANDWGEWFFGEPAFEMAFARLGDLIKAVYADEMLIDLEDFAKRYW